jgi:thiosulfate/3-mercaptopyruvate sulfurtransferase
VDPLVTTSWLAEHLDDPQLVLCDVRWYLKGKTGRDEYARGHIPGAQFVDLERELSAHGQPGPGRHPLPSPEQLAQVLSRLGVTPDSVVVAYDDAGGSIAARLWWLLDYVGHGGGRVLDGGIGAWVADGRPLETTPRTRPPAPPMTLEPRRDRVVDAEMVDRLRAGGALLLDARARERYLGQTEPVDARAGHIPGARNAPHAGNLDADGRLLGADALRARYRELGALDADTVVAYCGSGVTACHAILALARAGRGDVKLYEGSWSDWSRDPGRPLATDDER